MAYRMPFRGGIPQYSECRSVENSLKKATTYGGRRTARSLCCSSSVEWGENFTKSYIFLCWGGPFLVVVAKTLKLNP